MATPNQNSQETQVFDPNDLSGTRPTTDLNTVTAGQQTATGAAVAAEEVSVAGLQEQLQRAVNELGQAVHFDNQIRSGQSTSTYEDLAKDSGIGSVADAANAVSTVAMKIALLCQQQQQQ